MQACTLHAVNAIEHISTPQVQSIRQHCNSNGMKASLCMHACCEPTDIVRAKEFELS